MEDRLPKKRGNKGGPLKSSILGQLKRAYGQGFHPIMRQAELANKMQALADEVDNDSDKSTRDKLLAYKAAASLKSWQL